MADAARRKTIIIIVVCVLVICVLAGLGVGIWAAVRDSKRSRPAQTPSLMPNAERQRLLAAPLMSPSAVPPFTVPTVSATDGLPDSSVLVPKIRTALQRSMQMYVKGIDGPFPIDAVATWVDGTDAAWRAAAAMWYAREKKEHARIAHAPAREPEPVSPFMRDELFYNVHLAATHCPWLRTYFVVASRPQRPWWWPPSGRIGTMRVQLVYHDMIAPAGALLPTFNSNAIQAWIANIPGLAEHFILFDDDFFIGQPLSREHFFTQDGRPALRTYKCNVSSYDVPESATLWDSVCAFTAARIAAASGSSARPHFTEHVAVPILRSLWHELVTNWFRADIAQLRRFRSRTDFVLQYTLLGALHALGETRPIPAHFQTIFFLTGRFGMYMANGSKPPPHMFCINDRMAPGDRAAMDAIIDKYVSNIEKF